MTLLRISHFIKDRIPHQAVLINVLVMVGHVEVTLEPILWMVAVEVSLGIDAFIESTQHHSKR